MKRAGSPPAVSPPALRGEDAAFAWLGLGLGLGAWAGAGFEGTLTFFILHKYPTSLKA